MTCPAYEAYRKSACHWCAESAEPPHLHMHFHGLRHFYDNRPCTALSFPDWAQREHERAERLEKALFDIACDKFNGVPGGKIQRAAREALAELKEPS